MMTGLKMKNDQFFSVGSILKPDRPFFLLALIYGICIALLTLAVPISVQALLNTVVNTALPQFILLLALLLFIILMISAVMIICRDYAMELFQRRFLARLSSEIALRLTHADQPYMDGINRAELVNRFFEIIHVQKNVPALLMEGFFIVLQTVVGLVVVSFYHPFLFVFSLLFAGCLLLIWKFWSGRAISQAITLSDSKYSLVQWLEEIARVNQTFKSERAIAFALQDTNKRTENYLFSKRKYFRTVFAQNIAFLILYCLASASLLGLGGVLVARNQLSLGQLVGAELIMSAIFYSASKLSYYARIYYDLQANLNKLSYFFKLPMEPQGGNLFLGPGENSLSFEKVLVSYRGHDFSFRCRIEANSKVLAKSRDASGSKLLLDLIKGYREPEQGQILIGKEELFDYDLPLLRNQILSIDSVSVVEGSIRELFELYAPDITHTDIRSVLQLVELDQLVEKLPNGLDTYIVPSGYPLLQDEIVRLKLAALLAASPSILILTEIFDIVPYQIRERIMKALCNVTDLTLICFTNRKEWDFFNQYLLLEETGTSSFETLNQFRSHVGRNGMEE